MVETVTHAASYGDARLVDHALERAQVSPSVIAGGVHHGSTPRETALRFERGRRAPEGFHAIEGAAHGRIVAAR
jgi:hypothetical protein